MIDAQPAPHPSGAWHVTRKRAGKRDLFGRAVAIFSSDGTMGMVIDHPDGFDRGPTPMDITSTAWWTVDPITGIKVSQWVYESCWSSVNAIRDTAARASVVFLQL